MDGVSPRRVSRQQKGPLRVFDRQSFKLGVSFRLTVCVFKSEFWQTTPRNPIKFIYKNRLIYLLTEIFDVGVCFNGSGARFYRKQKIFFS